MDRVIINPMTNDDSWTTYLELTSQEPSSIIYILPHSLNAVYVTNDDTCYLLDKYPSEFIANGIQREFITVFDIYNLTEYALGYHSYQSYDYQDTDDLCIDNLLAELNAHKPKFHNSLPDKSKNLLLSKYRFNRRILDNTSDKVAMQAKQIQAQLKTFDNINSCIAAMPEVIKPMTYDELDDLRYHKSKK